MKRNLNNRLTFVYKAINPQDEVIYVGVAVDPGRRYAAHRTIGKLPSCCRFQIVDSYPTRKEALAEERRLIAELRPIFNKNGLVSVHEISKNWDKQLAVKMIAEGCDVKDIAIACDVDRGTIDHRCRKELYERYMSERAAHATLPEFVDDMGGGVYEELRGISASTLSRIVATPRR